MYRIMRVVPFCLLRGILFPALAVGAIIGAIAYAVSRDPENPKLEKASK